MAQEFKGFITKDGRAFASEIEATAHEVKRELEKSFPELRNILRADPRFDDMLRTLLPLTKLIHSSTSHEIPPVTKQPPGDHPWPEAVREAMNTDNLGEVYSQKSVRGEDKEIQPKHLIAAFTGESCGHDWRQTDDWKIDRCSKCGEERA